MILNYKGKKSEIKILNKILKFNLKSVSGNPKSKSKLIKGENLNVLEYLLIKKKMKGKIDLIYIDPPFSTNNVFKISEERATSISQIKNSKIAYTDSLVGPEFLEFIRERLLLLRELLSEKGSIYLHIDYKIGHYIKILMDEVFGKKNFLNDLTRIKCNPKNFSKRSYGNIKDMILFYSKSNSHIWNEQKEKMTENDIKKLFKKIDKSGRRYTTIPLHAPGETINGETGKSWGGISPPKGRHWRSSPKVLEKLQKDGLIEWSKNRIPRKKIFADEKDGKKLQDIWKFKDSQSPIYPTEKNIDLLKLIIKTSSNPNSLVLDCFSGSGTTLKVAQELGRFWIGIDNSNEAINITLKRLLNKQTRLLYNNDFEYLELQNSKETPILEISQ